MRNGNCSGCGACALLAPEIRMEVDSAGFLRPYLPPKELANRTRGTRSAATSTFRTVCPGRIVTRRPERGTTEHPTFGSYVSAWQGWATDPVVRERGSSGGVLTALAAWLIESGIVHEVTGVRADPVAPSRTVPVRIMSRDEALESSGSRYAPVGAVSLAPSSPGRSIGVIAKPCEIAARRALAREGEKGDSKDDPILLSFFCAGTPSQRATDTLVRDLGVSLDTLTSMRYRGDGWPGYFSATDADGATGRLTYEESWGQHLGRDLQDRCKICVDGTGELSDIAVGDYWRADEHGYPLFDNAEGNSVVIARTARGHELLTLALADGIIHLEPVSLDEVAAIQPLQARRIRELIARLAGRAAAGKRIPRYRGFRLIARRDRRLSVLLRTVAGTFSRALKSR